MPTGAHHLNIDNVRRRRNRTLADTDTPHRQLGLHVQGKNCRHTRQRTPADHRGSTSIHDLLGRLENASNTLRQSNTLLHRISHSARKTQQHRGVHVMATRMHHTRILRRERQTRVLRNRQRINIRTKSHPQGPWFRQTRGVIVFSAIRRGVINRMKIINVDIQAGGGKQHRFQPMMAQHFGDERRRLDLIMGGLGVRMQVLAPRSYLALVLGQPRGHRLKQPTRYVLRRIHRCR